MNIVIEYKIIEERFTQIRSLFESLGGFNETIFERDVMGKPGLLLCYAIINDKIIGCKIGFSPRPGYFESWIGGVSKTHQNAGIATQLQETQHKQCEEMGYKYLTTSTSNKNIPMQIINLKSGYNVIGTHLNRGTELKLLYEKEI